MNSFLRIMMIAIFGYVAFTSLAPAADKRPTKGITGTWHGALITDYVGSPALPLIHLRLVVKIERTSEGNYTGVSDSPDERRTGLPLSEITLSDSDFRFELKPSKAIFEGKHDQRTFRSEPFVPNL